MVSNDSVDCAQEYPPFVTSQYRRVLIHFFTIDSTRESLVFCEAIGDSLHLVAEVFEYVLLLDSD